MYSSSEMTDVKYVLGFGLIFVSLPRSVVPGLNVFRTHNFVLIILLYAGSTLLPWYLRSVGITELSSQNITSNFAFQRWSSCACLVLSAEIEHVMTKSHLSFVVP
jgi:hypothetical protein